MVLDTLRRIGMASLVVAIVGGLWTLASWKADLDLGTPVLYAQPPIESLDSFAEDLRQAGDEAVFYAPLAEARPESPAPRAIPS